MSSFLCFLSNALQVENRRILTLCTLPFLRKTIGQAAAALYGKEIFLTASRAERFALCPFSFFMEYGLKARPERPAAFDAPEIGVFTHWLLENVLREAGEKGGIRALSAEQVEALADKYTEIYISDTLSDFADKNPRFIHLFLRQAKSAKIVKILSYL